MDSAVTSCLVAIGITPRDLSPYRTALNHRSSGSDNNERLEFLGDTVLATVLSEYLIRRYPASDEGFLTRMRTKLARGTTQTMIAEKIGLRQYINLSERAENQGKREDDAVAEDAFEAIVGALFVDRGYEACAEWIAMTYEAHVDFAEAVREQVTNRELLDATARQMGETVSFEHTKMIRDRHKAIVRMDSPSAPLGVIIGVGEADSKKVAIEEACKRAVRFFCARRAAA